MKHTIIFSKVIFRITLLLILAGGMLLHPCENVKADTHTVTNNNDSGPGSLRYLINAVDPGDTIGFAGDMTINLLSTVVIDKNITINGSGLTITINGGNLHTVFQVNSGKVVHLYSLEIAYGYSATNGGAIINFGDLLVSESNFYLNNAVGNGGAIYNQNGSLKVEASSLTDNYATFGGGIYSEGGSLDVYTSYFAANYAASGGAIYSSSELDLWTSTFTENDATNAGGGLYLKGDSAKFVVDSTIEDNSAGNGGGGIYNYGLLFLRNATLANNSGAIGAGLSNGFNGNLYMLNTIIAYSSGGGTDCYDTASAVSQNLNNLVEDGSCSTGGVNLLSGDPLLGPLTFNGGPTKTMALSQSSPAIDAGDDANCQPYDQRLIPRPIRAHCDIGAYEIGLFTYLPLILR